MRVTVLFFGVFTELTGLPRLELQDVGDTETLMQELESRWPGIGERTHRLACNQQFLSGKIRQLQDGDEVAVMPPFAGG